MSLPVLRKINELVKAGATVAGIKPIATPSLSDDQNEFNKLVNEIWSSSNAKVSSDKPLSEVLNAMNIAPDFTYTNHKTIQNFCLYIVTLTDRDIYWVNNRNEQNRKL